VTPSASRPRLPRIRYFLLPETAALYWRPPAIGTILASVPLPLLPPMLASVGEPVRDPERWSTEVKWDGWRALVYVEDGLKVRTRAGRQVSDSLVLGTGRRIATSRAPHPAAMPEGTAVRPIGEAPDVPFGVWLGPAPSLGPYVLPLPSRRRTNRALAYALVPGRRARRQVSRVFEHPRVGAQGPARPPPWQGP
jgi:hypothetical protein